MVKVTVSPASTAFPLADFGELAAMLPPVNEPILIPYVGALTVTVMALLVVIAVFVPLTLLLVLVTTT